MTKNNAQSPTHSRMGSDMKIKKVLHINGGIVNMYTTEDYGVCVCDRNGKFTVYEPSANDLSLLVSLHQNVRPADPTVLKRSYFKDRVSMIGTVSGNSSLLIEDETPGVYRVVAESSIKYLCLLRVEDSWYEYILVAADGTVTTVASSCSVKPSVQKYMVKEILPSMFVGFALGLDDNIYIAECGGDIYQCTP